MQEMYGRDEVARALDAEREDIEENIIEVVSSWANEGSPLHGGIIDGLSVLGERLNEVREELKERGWG